MTELSILVKYNLDIWMKLIFIQMDLIEVILSDPFISGIFNSKLAHLRCRNHGLIFFSNEPSFQASKNDNFFKLLTNF